MEGWYHVYGQRPTAVSHSLRVNLFGPYQPVLAVARVNHIDIYEFDANGLVLLQELNVFGRVGSLASISSSEEGMDVLVVFTEAFDLFFVAYNSTTQKLETVTQRIDFNLMNPRKLPVDAIQICVDPDDRIIACHHYMGQIDVLEMNGCDVMRVQSIRHGADVILGMVLLHGCKEPTVAILQEDDISNESTGVREGEGEGGREGVGSNKLIRLGFYEIKTGRDTSVHVSSQWKTHGEAVSIFAHHLYAVPNTEGGVFVFCESGEVIYTDKKTTVKLPIESVAVQSVSCIDQENMMFLIGDESGEIGILRVERQKMKPNKVVRLVYERFGECNFPTSLTYLEDRIAFVGTKFSDSQVIKLVTSEDGRNSLTVLEEQRSLAPILDMCIVDQGEFGKKQIITASGVDRKGALRVVKQGVSIAATATVPLEDATKVWSLSSCRAQNAVSDMDGSEDTVKDGEHEEKKPKSRTTTDVNLPNGSPDRGTVHDTLAVSFGDSLAFLQFDNEEDLTGVDVGVEGEGKVIYCGNAGNDHWVVVQGDTVFVLENSTFTTTATWKADKMIGGCGCDGDRLVIASGQYMHMFLLNVESLEQGLEPVMSMSFEKELSSIALFTPKFPSSSSPQTYVLTSLWENHSVHLLLVDSETNTFVKKAQYSMTVDVVATSCALCQFSSHLYALFGLGDGTVNMFHLQPASDDGFEFVDATRVQVGKRPVDLIPSVVDGNDTVFAVSNETLLFYPENKSVAYASVNGEQMRSISFFNAKAYPTSYAFVTAHTFCIGNVKSVQKLHITTIPLNATPSVLQTNSDRSMIAVGLHKDNPYASEVRVFLAENMESFASFSFLDGEWINCIHVHVVEETDTECFLFGTAMVKEDELEPTEGRIVVATFDEEKKLKILTTITVNGSVYSMCNLQGHVATTINSRVVVYEFVLKGSDVELKPVCGHHGHGILVTSQAINDMLIVGDWFKSAAVLRFTERKLISLVEAPSSSWLTAASFIDQTLSFASDSNGNIYVNKMVSEEDRDKFEDIASWHTGEHVNVFRKGFLCDPADTHPNLAMERASAFVYGTISGSIGCLIPLSKTHFHLLREVERRLAQCSVSLGGLRHDVYRNPKTETMAQFQEGKGIVDGDLMETFLDMSADQKKQVCHDLTYKDFDEEKDMPASVDVVDKIILRMTLWH
eukprot:m.113903 g.113903  ORF g.113903 m.113903 type:complete len:1173 (+) comp12805_c0_seq4:71-3589(+)